MGEPLKEKVIACIETDLWDEGGKLPRAFRKKDVKSAVDWLKKKIKGGDVYEWFTDSDSDIVGHSYLDSDEITKGLMKLIDKAFEDVIKK